MMTSKAFAIAVVALSGLAGAASAQTITVDLATDDFDIPWGTATLSDLPGPDGRVSFPEALQVSDNTPGVQTIGFAIPVADWWLPNIYPGICKLQNLFSWIAMDTVIIDGTTQTAFTGDTNPAGAEMSLDGLQMYLNGDNSILTGFHDSRVEFFGSSSEIYGNTGGMRINVNYSSGSLVHDNEAFEIKLDHASNVVVVRNETWKVRVIGNFNTSNPATNNRIGGPLPSDRNFIKGSGTYHEGAPNGTAIELFGTKDMLIENNYIGTTPDGLAHASTSCTVGISLRDRNDNLMVRDNLIAVLGVGTWPHYNGVLFGTGIYIEGSGTGVYFYNNTIGLDSSGAPVLGAVQGVATGMSNYSGLTDIQIGGPNPGQGNIIGGHLETGVFVAGSWPQVRISGNSIKGAPDALGIDLSENNWTFGISQNDPLDADQGGNGIQNFPEITNVEPSLGAVRITGTLHSHPLNQFTVELFASSSCSTLGYGEGETYLGSTTVFTNLSGDGSFDVTLPAGVAPGDAITATATREPLGATSEFSPCFPVGPVGPTCQQDLGFGGPGNSVLTVCGGPLATGSTADLQLTGAAPNQIAALFLGLSNNPTSFRGGLLVPVPALATLMLSTDGSGQLSIPGLTGGFGPFTLYAQAGSSDPAQPRGVGLSNALRLQILP